MARTNRICKVCGKSYYYCPSCEGKESLQTWRVLTCSEECNTIFRTLQLHYQKNISNEDVAEILKGLDLSILKNANDSIKQQVKEILNSVLPKEDSQPKPIRKRNKIATDEIN